MSVTTSRDDAIREVAAKHGFDAEAAKVLASALARGNGTMAQFDHPALGGMGQWSRGGMLMIGDMFNDGLKGRVRALAEDLVRVLSDDRTGEGASGASSEVDSAEFSDRWWPGDLGSPSSSGGQNGDLYAVFPEKRRLAIRHGEEVSVYDTGDHAISGVSQQQGPSSTLSFGTTSGTVTVRDLRRIDLGQ